MFGIRRRPQTSDQALPQASVAASTLGKTVRIPRHRAAPTPSTDERGFTGLEGDFEAERRRAVGNEHAEPYEHDENPHLPGGWSGVTHP